MNIVCIINGADCGGRCNKHVILVVSGNGKRNEFFQAKWEYAISLVMTIGWEWESRYGNGKKGES